MARPSKKIPIRLRELAASVLLLSLAVFLIGRFLIELSFTDSSLYFLDKERVFLAEDSLLTQRFTATKDGFTAIGIPLDKSSLRPPKGTLTISLKDGTCQRILASEEINLLHIFYSQIPKVTFPTIPQSKGKTYCFEAAYALDETYNREGEFINLWRSPSPQFSSLYYSDNAEIAKGYSLLFKPYYDEPTLALSLTLLNQRLSQYKPEPLKGKSIPLLAGFTFLSSYALVIVLLYRKRRR